MTLRAPLSVIFYGKTSAPIRRTGNESLRSVLGSTIMLSGRCSRIVGHVEDITISGEGLRNYEELASMLRAKGYSVVAKKEFRVARAGVPSADLVAVFIGSAVATTLINAIVTDVYNDAKKWIHDRFNKKSEFSGTQLRLVIYSPDREVLGWWIINGERATESQNAQRNADGEKEQESSDPPVP